jgi:hypothetical protein
MHTSTETGINRHARSIIATAGLCVTIAAFLSTSDNRVLAQAETSDLVVTKQVDKASPTMMARSVDDVRSLCNKNPNCRVVRDDSQVTAFCVGSNCVAARKAGKGQMEFLQVTMTEALITTRMVKGPRIRSPGIIAVLVGRTVSPGTQKGGYEGGQKGGYDLKANVKAGRQFNATGKHIPKATITVREQNAPLLKNKSGPAAPPPNLLGSGSTIAPAGAGANKGGVKGTVAPSTGTGTPPVGTR